FRILRRFSKDVSLQKTCRTVIDCRVDVVLNECSLAAAVLIDPCNHITPGIDQTSGGPAGAAEEIHREKTSRGLRSRRFRVPLFAHVLIPSSLLMRRISAAVKTRHPFRSRPTSPVFPSRNHRNSVAFETPSSFAAAAVLRVSGLFTQLTLRM